MFSKRGRGYEETELSPSKRLRANLADLFLSNDISGSRALSLFQDADGAGAKGFKKLKKLAIQERTNIIAAGTSPGSSSGDAGGLHCTMQRLGCGIPGSRGSLIAICLCSFRMISSTTC